MLESKLDSVISDLRTPSLYVSMADVWAYSKISMFLTSAGNIGHYNDCCVQDMLFDRFTMCFISWLEENKTTGTIHVVTYIILFESVIIALVMQICLNQ